MTYEMSLGIYWREIFLMWNIYNNKKKKNENSMSTKAQFWASTSEHQEICAILFKKIKIKLFEFIFIY